MKPAATIMRWLNDSIRFCKGQIPGQLVIQITDRCNGACPQCGMNLNNNYPRRRLNNTDIEELIDWASDEGFRAISFTGGEPFLYYTDLLQVIKYASQAGIPYIRTGTNGFFLSSWEAKGFTEKVETMASEMVAAGLRNLWISIDSAQSSIHEQIRGLPGVVEGIRRAIPIFHSQGIFPSANLGINRWVGGSLQVDSDQTRDDFYQYMVEGFNRFFEAVIDMGFTMANVCYPMGSAGDEKSSWDPVYGAHSSHAMVCFSQEEKIEIFRALQDVIPRYRSRIRIFTPLSSLYALEMQMKGNPTYSFPCRGGVNFFFVSAQDGQVYPCGYRGHEKIQSLRGADKLRNSQCRLCEWECFRDPSELAGPLILGIGGPWKLVRKLRKDKNYTRLWWNDLRYYRACQFFNGRKAPKITDLHKFLPLVQKPFSQE